MAHHDCSHLVFWLATSELRTQRVIHVALGLDKVSETLLRMRLTTERGFPTKPASNCAWASCCACRLVGGWATRGKR